MMVAEIYTSLYDDIDFQNGNQLVSKHLPTWQMDNKCFARTQPSRGKRYCIGLKNRGATRSDALKAACGTRLQYQADFEIGTENGDSR